MTMIQRSSFVVVILAALLSPLPGSAQQAGASPATKALAENHTAIARGYAALGLNPAALGLGDTERVTLSLFPLSFGQSLDPLKFSDFVDYEGQIVPASVKNDWLQSIVAAGGQTGAGVVEVTPFSLTWGRVGFQLSTVARGQTDLNPSAAELLFFGNAGRTGEAGDFQLSGSGLTGYALTTFSLSFGMPISRRWVPGVEQGLSVGATVKQTWGHALVHAQDAGTALTSDPLELEMRFPMIYSDDDAGFWDAGSGLGLDLGAAWRQGPWEAAVAVHNIVNSFGWDRGAMVWRPGVVDLASDTTFSSLDEQPGRTAPPVLKDFVDDLTIGPSATLAGAFHGSETMTVTVEFRQRTGDGIVLGPKSHAGMGVEFRPSPFIPIRAGAAYITGGFQAGGGFELILGPVHIGAAGLYRSGDVEDGFTGSFGLSFGG